MLTLSSRLLAGIVMLAASSFVSATSPATWPVSPSRLHLPTPYGTLDIATSEYVYESRLRVDSIDVNPPVKGMLNITYAFSTPKAQVALISINSGNNGCPVAYRWVVLDKSGYTVSPEFGSCSEQIKVSAKGRLFTLQTPSSQAPDQIDVYTYDGKSIKHRTTSTP
ncbi:hypothetical protein RE432_16250 [Pusillimonas sp. SM2304]|uniref:hypothetical protein n=1 Tax=Pusillimonas sp. SM2304 TaxID=3073241 RepID=UPI0028751ED2|nr:hypothetical protein [Pusillimonas sp. SM2304]MDS1141995.1 hypothetical protein [Pusillimonas sp. SM2304]